MGRASVRPKQCALSLSLPLSTLRVTQCTRPEGRHLASTSKRKTTMAKLNRERKLLEKRAEKQAKKEARKLAAANQSAPSEPVTGYDA